MTDARRTAVAILATALVACAAAACSPGADVSYPDAANYDCLGTTVPASAITANLTADEATGTAREAIDAAVWDDESPLELGDETAWVVVAESDEQVVLLRGLSADEQQSLTGGLPGSDHERLTLEWVDSTNVGPGWLVAAAGVCPLTIQLGGLEVPTLQLDPSQLPEASDTQIHLWVTETACASGQTAEDLIEEVAVVETDDAVTIVIGVRERTGDQTCQGNPPTPYTVALDAPLGDREIIDGTRGVQMGTG